MFKYLCVLSVIAASCKDKPRNIELLSSWSTSSSIPPKEDAAQLSNLKNHWITFLYKGDVYATTEDSSVPESINIHKPGLEQLVACRAEKGMRSIKKVADGYLAGFDCEEFGGSLCLFSPKGDFLYEILSHQVNEIVQRNGVFYALSELGDTGWYSNNTIIKIKKQGPKWMAEKYLDLPSYGAGFDIDKNGDFIVITNKSLLRIDSLKSIHILIRNGFWSGGIYGNLFPTSVTIKNNAAFIGMISGVLQYDIATGKQSWLSKNEKRN